MAKDPTSAVEPYKGELVTVTIEYVGFFSELAHKNSETVRIPALSEDAKPEIRRYLSDNYGIEKYFYISRTPGPPIESEAADRFYNNDILKIIPILSGG